MSEFVVSIDQAQAVERRQSPRLLHGFFEAQVARRPHQVAVECAGQSLTYLELDTYANQVARTLRKRGVVAGSLVAIYLEKSTRQFAAILGVLKAGAGYIPIDPRFPLERIEAILDDSKAHTIVTETELAEQLAGALTTPLLRLDEDDDEIVGQPTGPLSPELIGVRSDSLAYVIYTSGSTGRPKGVMIEHGNAVAFVRTLQEVYEVGPDDRVYQGFSAAFDASVEEIWAALSIGGTLVVPTEEVSRSPSDVAEFVSSNRITYFSTVPTLLAMIDRDLPTVRTLVLGGEACSQELVGRWAKPGRRMLNTYGPTEATVVATYAECVSGSPVTIGMPLPGYTAYVLDENMEPVETGQDGELYIGGRGVARGYMNLPELTGERFLPNPFRPNSGDRLYRTHDLVRTNEAGELLFLGRIDDQIKIRGFRVELSEIEAVLLEHPQIRAAAVAVTETTELKELAAFVVCDEGDQQLDREEISETLRRRVPEYMVPQYLDVVDNLPMMPSGKVDRRRLPKPETLLKGTGTIVPPDTDLERCIAAAWQEGFRLPEVSVTQDFFVDLGGHSLLVAQIVTLMRTAIGSSQLSVRDIYDHRTIRDLARHLEQRGITGPAEEPAKEIPKATAAEQAFHSVSPVERWTVVGLQAVSVLLYYGVLALPLTYAVLLTLSVIDGHRSWSDAALMMTLVSFAIWPAMLLTSITIKWLVIGRIKPGRYPVWGLYYFRWWLVTRFQALSWSEMFSGTPLMNLYWRAMGAKIGRNVTLNTSLCTAFDVVSIGENSSVGLESQVLGCRVEDGHLIVAPVAIGRDCFVGMHCTLGLGTSMGDGARLDDMSMLPDKATMLPGEARRGSPASPAEVIVPEGRTSKPGRMRSGVFAFLHLVLIYAMGYFLIAISVPTVIMVLAGLMWGGPLYAVGAAFLAVPVWILTYVVCAIALKSLLGPVKAGTIPVKSFAYLHHWFTVYLLENTKNILMPVYATVYLPAFLRALGAKVGRGSEISTVSHIHPDLLEVGDGSFLADACLIGGNRTNDGLVETGTVRIGARSFVGNSALVSGGHTIGDNALIGVASTPPANTRDVPGNTRWLGSPGFVLPRTQQNLCFTDGEIFTPGPGAIAARTAVDTLRILLPGWILVANALAFVSLLVVAYRVLPFWAVLGLLPAAATAFAFAAVAASALVKRMITRRLGPVAKPLWSPFIWFNELVNGVFENVAAPAMSAMMGTPFIAPCLRMMGCRVGKWCYLGTTLFSEFDLVEIGDYATLNIGATVQTHLFEDRVFKADRLRIGDGCNVGNMGTVLYGTEMRAGSGLGPLSVLMKGETLPPGTRWHGTPCEQERSAENSGGTFHTGPANDASSALAQRNELLIQVTV
jgi:non-ribosomal peptide synthetase-like protein